MQPGEQRCLQPSPHRQPHRQVDAADVAEQDRGLLDAEQPALERFQPAGQRQQQQRLPSRLRAALS